MGRKGDEDVYSDKNDLVKWLRCSWAEELAVHDPRHAADSCLSCPLGLGPATCPHA